MSSPIGSAAPSADKKWTILYYFDGKNNLAPMAQHSFDSLDQVGSSKNVNLVAQIGLPNQKVLQGLVHGGTGTAGFQSMGNADMGSGDNLKQFVEWGMQNYPAEHYALVVWDHGAGFEGSCVDEGHKHLITNADMAKALEDAHQDTGKKIDVLNWNCCLMQQAETAYALRNATDYMVGSQEVEAGLRIPIPGVFGTTPQHLVAKDVQEAINKKGDLAPEDLAKLFVFESKNQFGASMFTPTQSAIDEHQASNLRDKMNALATLLNDAAKADPKIIDVIRGDIKRSQRMLAADMYIEPYVDYRDVGDFARTIAKDGRFTDPRIAAAARDLEGAVHGAVVAEWHAPQSSMGGKSLEGSTGVTAYLPRDYGFDKPGKSTIDNLPQGGTHGYEKTDFAQNSSWLQLLQTISKDDDLMGKFPSLQRSTESFPQIANIMGYQYAYDILSGMKSAGSLTSLNGWTVWPTMGFPFFLPIPNAVACGAGMVGGALRMHNGISSIAEGIRREDSPASHRRTLIANGAVDAAIGAGSIATCGALIAGAGPAAAPIAAATLALGAGRMAYNLATALYHRHKVAGMTVEQKLDAMKDTRPVFKSLQSQPPAAPAPAPAQQPTSQQPAQAAA